MTLLQATRAAHAERTGKSAAEVADLDFCCMSREDVMAGREAARFTWDTRPTRIARPQSK